MEHFKTVCRVCEVIINQCRCPSNDKTVESVICSKCHTQRKEMEVHVDDAISKDIEVVNIDTGESLDRCQYANQETGEYETTLTEEEIKERGLHNFKGFPTEVRKANIVLAYKGE